MPNGDFSKNGSGKSLVYIERPYLGVVPDHLLDRNVDNGSDDLMSDDFAEFQSGVQNFVKMVSKESVFDDDEKTRSINPENQPLQNPINQIVENVTPQINIQDSLELAQVPNNNYSPSYSPANPQVLSLGSRADFGAATPSLPETEGNTWDVLSQSHDSQHEIQAGRAFRRLDTPSTTF